MLEALEASSLHGFQCDRQLRLELYSATFALPRKTRAETVFCSRSLKKEEPHPGLQHCFGGKRDRGEALMLNVSVRPQPAAGLSMHAESQRGNDRRHVLVDFGFTPEALNNNVELLGIDP